MNKFKKVMIYLLLLFIGGGLNAAFFDFNWSFFLLLFFNQAGAVVIYSWVWEDWHVTKKNNS